MGDVIRRIARAFYERAGEEEKKEAKELFKKLNSNGDGKIRVGEFKKGVDSSQLANEKVFNELDSNRDGALDFDDVLVLFYYKKKRITILRCGGSSCGELIFGPSFSCFQCLFNSVDRRYALCRDCYEGDKFHHQHQLSSTMLSPPTSTSGDLLRDQAILVKLSQLMPKDPKSLTKTKMKKMWETAKSGASPQLEAMANNFFESVDINGVNRVNIQQFSTLMRKQESDELEAFLKPREDSDFATNFMKDKLRRKLADQSTTPATVAHNEATTSTPHTHYVNPAPTHHLNRETSSNAIVPILKVATTTFKIVDMALTIASLSGMCTIM